MWALYIIAQMHVDNNSHILIIILFARKVKAILIKLLAEITTQYRIYKAKVNKNIPARESTATQARKHTHNLPGGQRRPEAIHERETTEV